MEPEDIMDWAPEGIKKIQVSQVFLHAPFELVVRRFIPKEGDRLQKVWQDENGVVKRFPVPPYAIFNMAEAARSIDAMIRVSQHIYLDSLLKRHTAPLGGDFLWDTYCFAFRHPTQVEVGYYPYLLLRTLCAYTENFWNPERDGTVTDLELVSPLGCMSPYLVSGRNCRPRNLGSIRQDRLRVWTRPSG